MNITAGVRDHTDLMTVPIRTRPELKIGQPTFLLSGTYRAGRVVLDARTH